MSNMEHWFESLSKSSLKTYRENRDPPPIDYSEWPHWVELKALTREYTQFLRSLSRRDENPLNEQQIRTHFEARGIKLGKVYRPTVEYFDGRTDTKVVVKPRLYEFPMRESIQDYLRETYGDTWDDDVNTISDPEGGEKKATPPPDAEY